MTLGRRMAIQLILLLACLTLTAAVGLWGIVGLRQDFTLALENYERLRQLYQIGFHLQSARMALSGDFAEAARARLETRRAEDILSRLSPTLPLTEADKKASADLIGRAVAQLATNRPSPDALEAAISKLQDIVAVLRGQIEQAQASAEARKRRNLWALGNVAGISILVSVVIGWMQLRSVLRPLRAINAGVRRIASQHFDARLMMDDADREWVELSRDFNRMSTQLQQLYGQLTERVEAATRSLLQNERLAGVGLLAAGVAHEINNPLAIITGRIELLKARLDDESAKQSLEIALDEAFRCKKIIDRLLSVSRGPRGEQGAVALDALVRAVVNNVRALPGRDRREISVGDSDPLVVRADDGELKQVLLNLLINAIQATEPDGTIEVTVTAAGAWAEVSVTDNGGGMTKETLERLFEPFFSTRPGEGRGTGLGLTITSAIIESHGGTLQASSPGPGKGSTFLMRLPTVTDEEVGQIIQADQTSIE